MANIQPTLDLIDGALGDYLSPDAMRWTPDETERAKSNPHRVRIDSDAARESLRILGEQMAERFRAVGQSVRVFLDALAQAVKPSMSAVATMEAMKRERMRCLHSSYRQRTLASRRRRNR